MKIVAFNDNPFQEAQERALRVTYIPEELKVILKDSHNSNKTNNNKAKKKGIRNKK